MKLPFEEADPADRDFQYLEDLSTGYWYSEVLFAALELRLFEFLEQGYSKLDTLARASGCHPDELHRFLRVLERLELTHETEGAWFNSQVARLYLVPASQSYMGDFFLYRRHMQPRWIELVQRVSMETRERGRPLSHCDDYEIRTFHYVRALDQVAQRKAAEIVALLALEPWEPPILDIGGGAGALSRALISTKEQDDSTLFELPEVIHAARRLYPDAETWERIRTVGGDFRTYEFETESRFGLVVLSNFLHAYGGVEARRLLRKALDLVKPRGLLLIHDYFPDRLGRSPQKGPLYDLHMMLNTYEGVCHESSQITEWLCYEGMSHIRVRDLATDSSVILATRQKVGREDEIDLEEWVYFARHEGFRRAVLVSAENIITAPWVRMKCKSGCARYGQNLQCPPHGMESHATKEMLESYTWTLLLEGTPPGRDFHKKLLQMEKRAFLAGFHKAFVFGAGPCPVCIDCPEDGICRHPDLARPSMEGSGIDVYSTVQNAGIRLTPVADKGLHVKYIGLMLLE